MNPVRSKSPSYFFLCRSEFENLPLLRSTFFHLGLSLARSEGLLNAVVEANDMGEANIYLNSKVDTSFHYTLYNCKNGSTSIKAPGGKFPLDRYWEHCINIKTEEKVLWIYHQGRTMGGRFSILSFNSLNIF